jgi:hypothetical protein
MATAALAAAHGKSFAPRPVKSKGPAHCCAGPLGRAGSISRKMIPREPRGRPGRWGGFAGAAGGPCPYRRCGGV